jgi:hypothetical protein
MSGIVGVPGQSPSGRSSDLPDEALPFGRLCDNREMKGLSAGSTDTSRVRTRSRSDRGGSEVGFP